MTSLTLTVLTPVAKYWKGVIKTETLNLLKKLNDKQAFDFITEKPPQFLEELNQFEKYSFSVYSDDLWEYDPQAKTDEFITYLIYTYKEKWRNIYKNDLQTFGTNISISKNTNKEDNNNYIQTNDGVKAVLNGEDKTKTTTNVTTNSLNIDDIKSFFTIVLSDIKNEILFYKGDY